jgi:hypothetical protein
MSAFNSYTVEPSNEEKEALRVIFEKHHNDDMDAQLYTTEDSMQTALLRAFELGARRASSQPEKSPADPSGDLMILRMALGNTAACLGDALATYNRYVGEEVFKNAPPQGTTCGLATKTGGVCPPAVAASPGPSDESKK